MAWVIKSLVILTTVAIATAVETLKPGLRVTFSGDNSTKGRTHFFYAPTTEQEAVDAGWILTERPPGYLPQLIMYCYHDKVVCCLFDDTGYIAGTQVAISKIDFTNSVFDWKKRGFTSWYTTVNDQCKAFWTLQQYFVDENFLSKCKKERLEARDKTRLLQADAIWFAGTNGITKVSDLETDVAGKNIFTKQACLTQMGQAVGPSFPTGNDITWLKPPVAASQHYYYKMGPDTQCNDEMMYPWGVMFTNGVLTTSSLLTFGKLANINGMRNWFERADAKTARTFINNGPNCLYAFADNPGIVSMHFYFVSNPEDIICPA